MLAVSGRGLRVLMGDLSGLDQSAVLRVVEGIRRIPFSAAQVEMAIGGSLMLVGRW